MGGQVDGIIAQQRRCRAQPHPWGAQQDWARGVWRGIQAAGGGDGGEEETLVRPLSDHERLVEFMRRLSLAHATKQASRTRAGPWPWLRPCRADSPAPPSGHALAWLPAPPPKGRLEAGR